MDKYAAQGVTIDPSVVFDEYMKSSKERDFMCLSRDPKLSRIFLLHGMRAYGLLENGYVSNLMPTNITVEFNKLDNPYIQTLYRDIKSGPMPRMEVDYIDEHHLTRALAHNGTAGVLPLDHMRMSCYDIVQETTTRYDVPGVVDQGVVTEKTVKSLMFGRPFMINGGPEVLKVIRNMGFKTCSYLFDESYDDTSDLLQRQYIILSNALRWRSRREELMRRVQANAADLEYNMRRMMNFPVEAELIRSLAM